MEVDIGIVVIQAERQNDYIRRLCAFFTWTSLVLALVVPPWLVP